MTCDFISQDTGSVKPAAHKDDKRENEITSQEIKRKIDEYRATNSSMLGWEIR